MTLIIMQDNKNNIVFQKKYCVSVYLGNPNDDRDNKTQDYREYKRKTIMMAITPMIMQDYRNNIGDSNDFGDYNVDDND